MTRREFLFSVAPAALRPARPLPVPVHIVLDAAAAWQPGQVVRFWRDLWPESARDFARCGIQLQIVLGAGDIDRRPGVQPFLHGLDHGVINLVLTNRIPMMWDQGRILSGITMRYRGYALCMIAMDHAHGNQIPYVSVNTCTHELLHALTLDVLQERPPGWAGQVREFRIDCFATNLWVFHDGAAVRRISEKAVDILRTRM